MRPLILGLGQDSVVMSHIFENKGINYRIVARRSSGSISKTKHGNINFDKIYFVPEINQFELLKLKKSYNFTHIFNFAANSFVQDSKFNFDFFVNSNSKLLWELLELRNEDPKIWLFHPLSSELLQKQIEPDSGPLNLMPRNAYGVAKANDYHCCRIINDNTDMHVNYCIMFNHESRFRPPQFFTKKIISAFQAASKSDPVDLNVYNCKSVRDWGSAYEFMEIICESAENNKSGETVLGTGTLLSVEKFIDECFKLSHLEYKKSKENNLFTWRSDYINIKEKNRDLADERRVVCAPLTRVKQSFAKIPQIHGKQLIKGLLDGTI